MEQFHNFCFELTIAFLRIDNSQNIHPTIENGRGVLFPLFFGASFVST
jgi:hypothetical protein